MDKGERVWIREGPGRGLRAGSHPTKKDKRMQDPGKMQELQQECRIPPASGTAMQELPQAGWARGQEGLGALRTPCSCCLFPGNLGTTPAFLVVLPHAKAKNSRAELSLPLSLPVPPDAPWNCLGACQDLPSSFVDLFQGEGHSQERKRLFAL